MVSVISRGFKKFVNMSKSALIILAPGAEEMEFIIAADVLRRAGIKVTVGGLNGSEPVKCSRDVHILPDIELSKVAADKFDVVVLPGGLGGSNAMGDSPVVGDILKAHEDGGKLIAAICAAPTVLAKHGIATGKSLTSYPSMKEQLVDKYSYVEGELVVQDGNLITSRGPGTAYDFALKIAEELVGKAKAQEVAKGLLVAYN
ncbi:protein dj-1beta [Drosophila kikkawai]|uniref:Protein dj-1beta n=1 Tax=Drosophila kikkawai TaxID=30033 RepID=A0A6P4IDV1_DROKI|nr:protein dj-1beta [Drosophila kikkawai]